MSTHQGDWDREEREVLSRLDDQFDAMRRRHANDPPFELLSAGNEAVLPPELQHVIDEHLTSSPMSRALVEGGATARVEPEEAALSVEEQNRLLERILKNARQDNEGSPRWGWFRPVLLGSGLAAAAAIAWFVAARLQVREPLFPPETQVVVAEPPALPPFLLGFEKPDVRISMAALTWRGSTAGNNQLLADLKAGLGAYRQSDYQTANRELTTLAARYPNTIEVVFYQGVSRLFLNDLPGALESLRTAERLNDPTFANDVSWFLAVAEQRSGDVSGARDRLDGLCRQSTDASPRACMALQQLSTPSSPR